MTSALKMNGEGARFEWTPVAKNILELIQTPVWIFDVDRKAIPWGNPGACRLWSAESLSELENRDFSDISASALARLTSYFDRIERGEQVKEQWTFYPKSQEPKSQAPNSHDSKSPESEKSDGVHTVTVMAYYSIVQFDGRKAFLIEGHIREKEEINEDHLRIIEAMRHAPLCIHAFSLAHEVIYQNPKSIETYGSFKSKSASESSSTFDWFASPQESAQALAALKSDSVYVGEHQIVSGDGRSNWHEITARKINDPVTGRKINLFIESNINGRKEIERSLAQAHLELKKNHQLTSAMLESINQVFLIFDESGFCMNEVSECSKTLLNSDPSGKHLHEILNDRKLSRATVDAWLKLIFAETIPFEELVGLGSKRIYVAETSVTLDLNFHPMREESGEMTELILTAKDITKELNQKAVADEERATSEMVLRLIDFKNGFRSFVVDMERLIESMRAPNEQRLESIQTNLHTQKGAAGLFYLHSIAREINQTEQRLKAATNAREVLLFEGKRLRQTFDRWLADNENLLRKLGITGERLIEINLSRLNQVIEKHCSELGSEVLSAIEKDLAVEPFEKLLQPFEKHVGDVSARLKKPVQFSITNSGEDVRVNPDDYLQVVKTFVHLFNNSLDHGIENSEERQFLKKPLQGRINIDFGFVQNSSARFIRILVSDDGAGIDIGKIREKLVAGGSAAADVESLSDLEVASKIFEAKISTSDRLTEISGHGIGMSAMYQAVKEFGGSTRILKTDRAGTQFEILLPYLN